MKFFENMNAKQISPTIKGIVFIITLFWIICLVISFLQSYYQIIFPPLNSPLITLHIIINGILCMYLSPRSQTCSTQLAKIWYIFFNIFLLIFTLNIMVNQLILGGYLSIICSFFILFPATYRLYTFYYFKEKASSQSTINSSQLSSVQQNDQYRNISLQTQKDLKTKIKTNCFYLTSVLVFILLSLLSFSLLNCASSLNQYKPVGKIIEIEINDDHDSLYYHIYCTENKSNFSKPLILLFHGAGSNLMAFAELQKHLTDSNIASCAYDRLGYGRSQVSPEKDQSPQAQAKRINQLIKIAISKYYGPQFANISIVLAGWSAGVQIIQNYYYYYPSKISGLIYVDGYPDYLALQAISKNGSQYTFSEKPFFIVFQLHLLKFLQPYLSPFFHPTVEIEDENIQDYYNAYSQTGYFWSSQYLDYTNGHSLTQQLSNIGNKQKWPKPYPTSSIDLNWPNIKVPLLVMPANSTINTQYNGQRIYYLQCQKYIQKANNFSKMTVISGQHDYIISQQASTAANQIKMFLLNQ